MRVIYNLYESQKIQGTGNARILSIKKCGTEMFFVFIVLLVTVIFHAFSGVL